MRSKLETEHFPRVEGNAPVVPNPPPGLNACFVARTLVHTDKGLVAIDKLKFGDMVLSQPELQGEKAYRRVLKTVAHENQEVWVLEYVVGYEEFSRGLVCTGNHPFWIVNQGWTRADQLNPGDDLEMLNGELAYVLKIRQVFETDIPDVGWACDDGGSRGPTVDLRNQSVEVSKAYDGYTTNEYVLGNNFNEFIKSTVYNIEVEGFHSYYVGEIGVWVHDTNCAETIENEVHSYKQENLQPEVTILMGISDSDGKVADALRKGAPKFSTEPLAGDRTMTRPEVDDTGPHIQDFPDEHTDPACFINGTYVHTIYGWSEIQDIEVGTPVLSRCDKTGEQAYRPVVKVFEHRDKEVLNIQWANESGNVEEVCATPEHPFWVNGIGWLEASQLQAGHELEICNPKGSKNTEQTLSGERWQAKVVSVTKDTKNRWPVYNLEVEEFHTYFVGYLGVLVHSIKGSPRYLTHMKNSIHKHVP